MRKIVPFAALACAACMPAADNKGAVEPGTAAAEDRPARTFASQTEAPTPDFRALMRQPKLTGEGYTRRPATAREPANAGAIGRAWVARLEARKALLGYGLSGKTDTSPVSMIDVGMTASEFDRWVSQNGWSVPAHIDWNFVPGLNLPAVSKAAREGIRVWPASTARTGAQNEALLGGRVELRDGCIWVGTFGEPANKLAWFHAEIGLDRDAEGFYVLRSRVSGETLARLGEEMRWGGPASAVLDEDTVAKLRTACGDAPIYTVGSPESAELFFTQYPHTRPGVAPPPPAPPPSQPAT